MYKINDKIMFYPALYGCGSGLLGDDPVPGRVVYIHPQQRFLVVERRTARDRYREALKLKGDGAVEIDCDYES